MRPVSADVARCVVCVSVSGTLVCPAETSEPIEMLADSVGSRNCVFDGVPLVRIGAIGEYDGTVCACG